MQKIQTFECLGALPIDPRHTALSHCRFLVPLLILHVCWSCFEISLHAKANGRRPVGRPRTRWTDYIEDLGWNRLGLRPSEMMDVMEDREVWQLNLELLPPQPSRKSGQWRKKKKTMRSYWARQKAAWLNW